MEYKAFFNVDGVADIFNFEHSEDKSLARYQAICQFLERHPEVHYKPRALYGSPQTNGWKGTINIKALTSKFRWADREKEEEVKNAQT